MAQGAHSSPEQRTCVVCYMSFAHTQYTPPAKYRPARIPIPHQGRLAVVHGNSTGCKRSARAPAAIRSRGIGIPHHPAKTLRIKNIEQPEKKKKLSNGKIGRATGRERVCQNVKKQMVGVTLK